MTPEIINAQNQVKELEVLAAQDSKRYGVDLNIWKQKLAQYQEHAIANSPEASALLKSNPAAYMQKYGSPTDIANLPQTLALKTGGATGYAPTTQPITNNVPSGGGSTYTPPQLTSNATTTAYFGSVSNDVQNARTNLEATYTKQIAELDRKQQETQMKIDEFTAKETSALGEVNTLTQPFRENLENAERERLYINENFEANQKLTNELESLLSEGNTLILQMQGKSGLAGIRNPRINQAIEGVQARASVIQSVFAARSNQILEAYRVIDRGVNAINADREDRLGYYNSLLNFYSEQKSEEGKKLITLEKDEKDYLNAQIGLLQEDLSRTQETADYIKKLMTSPESASFVARAGISLNDSIATINQKMATQTQRDEIDETKNKLIAQGYTFVPFPGVQGGTNLAPFTVGGQTLYFKKPPEKESESDINAGKVSNQFSLGQQFISDNPTASNVELEIEMRKRLPNLTDADIKSILSSKKLTRAQIESTVTAKTAYDGLKETYTESELKDLADEYGYSSFWTGKESDIERFLNSTEAKTVYVDLLYKQYQQAGMAQ